MVKVQRSRNQLFLTIPKDLATELGITKGTNIFFSSYKKKELLLKIGKW